MPTNRRTVERPIRALITPELVELYRRCLEIYEDGDDDAWETDNPPGRAGELRDASLELHRGLNLRPWDYSVFWVSLDGPPAPHHDPARHALAQALRQALHERLEQRE